MRQANAKQRGEVLAGVWSRCRSRNGIVNSQKFLAGALDPGAEHEVRTQNSSLPAPGIAFRRVIR